MTRVLIENPVINSAFEEPRKHFRFDEEGITNEIVESRRPSSYFVPIASPRKKGKQLSLETQWTGDRIQENSEINRLRARVGAWRKGGYPGVTRTTARLLEWWTRAERGRRLFFCQLEAVETAIYIAEAASKFNDGWIANRLRETNEEVGNSTLPRQAFKMATGSGKTVVMAMLIAWHALNKAASPQDARFADAFLVVTPGITIRDRLRVLLPSDPDNYYRHWDLIPPGMTDGLSRAKIHVTNFHAFLLREKVSAGKLTKSILQKDGENPFTETSDQMVRRVCGRDLGTKRNILVLNDEAHHCYRRKPSEEDEGLKGEDRREAEQREEEARIWINGLEAVQKNLGVRAVYDLSATPFFLKGSGFSEGTLFPWVVSDFSLVDAIESGVVKVPRVPVGDDSGTGTLPAYRDLWPLIREDLPKKSRKTEEVTGEPKPPKELQAALHSLYGDYEKYHQVWEKDPEAGAKGLTPPVFIVVCNNTNVSKLVFDYISGWEKTLKGGKTILVPGQLPLFSNVEWDRWSVRPKSILIDSQQLDSGEGLSKEFREIASREIQEFKDDYRLRFPGRDADDLTDEDILREVMNTVGRAGKLGEQVKCVVSVSMLTEGWDANTVTHILGVRAFGTQLLCEQVVGRALRRRSYALGEGGLFPPEYAEVYGVPFSFIPTAGSAGALLPGPQPTRVRALEERAALEINFPRISGYRFDLPGERLSCRFTDESRMTLSTEDVPTKVRLDPIVGESSIHTLDDLKKRREQEVCFLLAKKVLETYFRDGDEGTRPWLFPQILGIARAWLKESLVLKDNTFPQLLLLVEFAQDAADVIYRAIVRSSEGEKTLKPILKPYDTLGSTRFVDFDTIRPVFRTDPGKCHISHVVADTGSWEQKLASALEEMDEVESYVKNDHLDFSIPYVLNGEERNYYPDFIARIKMTPFPLEGEGRGEGDSICLSPSPPEGEGRGEGGIILNLILEVTGEKKKDKEAKVSTARTLWIPAVNNHGGFGRWAFLEIRDPWNAKNTIRAFLGERRV